MPTAQNGETELNWMAVGEGPALLLIHGGGGNAAVWWQQIEGLSDSFKVVAYDHRNFGRSSSQIGQFREEDFVGDALAVMDAAGISEATVVAQSLGGWTGLRLALAAPKRVTNLILSCSNAGVDYQPAVDSIYAALEKMDDRGPASIGLGPKVLVQNPAKVYLYQQIRAFNEDMLQEVGESLNAPSLVLPLERLAEVKCPVLYIMGEKDMLLPPPILDPIARAFRDCEVQIIPASGHSPYYEFPSVFNSIVRDFVNRLS